MIDSIQDEFAFLTNWMVMMIISFIQIQYNNNQKSKSKNIAKIGKIRFK